MAVSSKSTKTTKNAHTGSSRADNHLDLDELLVGSNRVPPRNLDAEKALLGSLLLDKDAIVKISDSLSAEQFYDGKHGIIYDAIIKLFQENTPADLVTISNLLKANDHLDRVGGSGYIADLVNAVPTASNVEHYAGIIKENYIRRSLISTSAVMSDMSFDQALPVSDILNNAEREIFNITQGNMKRNFTSIQSTLAENFDRLEDLHQNKGKLKGIPTGFRDIDAKLAGLQDSALIILAARPSVGKTSLALNICQYVAVHEKLPVGFFSLESSKEELVDRLLSSQSNIDAWKITTGNLNDKDWESLTDAMGELAEAPLYIDDTPAMSIMDMRTKARRLQMEHGCRLIVVDYLQLAKSRNLENRVNEISEVSQGLKNIARELRCPVIALSQLSRNVEQRGTPDKAAAPQLSDLRDSGSIEQDADVVMFLWREDNSLASRSASDTIPVKLSVAKHRTGSIGEIDLIFKGARTRYYGVEKKRDTSEA
jgi:replicative DNA helicase